MLLGIVFLLYPREFSLQALALTAAMLYYINVTDFRKKRKASLEEGK